MVRSYSIANAPRGDALISLLVTRVPAVPAAVGGKLVNHEAARGSDLEHPAQDAVPVQIADPQQ